MAPEPTPKPVRTRPLCLRPSLPDLRRVDKLGPGMGWMRAWDRIPLQDRPGSRNRSPPGFGGFWGVSLLVRSDLWWPDFGPFRGVTFSVIPRILRTRSISGGPGPANDQTWAKTGRI